MRQQRLSTDIRQDIAARFSDGAAFTSFDFHALCERRGKPVKAAPTSCATWQPMG